MYLEQSGEALRKCAVYPVASSTPGHLLHSPPGILYVSQSEKQWLCKILRCQAVYFAVFLLSSLRLSREQTDSLLFHPQIDPALFANVLNECCYFLTRFSVSGANWNHLGSFSTPADQAAPQTN